MHPSPFPCVVLGIDPPTNQPRYMNDQGQARDPDSEKKWETGRGMGEIYIRVGGF